MVVLQYKLCIRTGKKSYSVKTETGDYKNESKEGNKIFDKILVFSVIIFHNTLFGTFKSGNSKGIKFNVKNKKYDGERLGKTNKK